MTRFVCTHPEVCIEDRLCHIESTDGINFNHLKQEKKRILAITGNCTPKHIPVLNALGERLLAGHTKFPAAPSGEQVYM